MISDDQLYSLAVFLGSLAMLLIVLYHFLEVNAPDDVDELKVGGGRGGDTTSTTGGATAAGAAAGAGNGGGKSPTTPGGNGKTVRFSAIQKAAR